MTLLDRIELDSRVCNGKPVIKGTRIPVSIIIEQISEGESWESILAGYPELTREDIQAALQYEGVAKKSGIMVHGSCRRE